MCDDLGKHFGDVRAAHHDVVVLAAEERCHLALILRFVVLSVSEAQRERLKFASLRAESHRRSECAVESAGQVAADRDIRAQHAQARRILERVSYRDDRVLERAGKATAVTIGE
jgi:hypothetical protein